MRAVPETVSRIRSALTRLLDRFPEVREPHGRLPEDGVDLEAGAPREDGDPVGVDLDADVRVERDPSPGHDDRERPRREKAKVDVLLPPIAVGDARRELLADEDSAARVLFGVDRDAREAETGVPRDDRAAGFVKRDETTEPQRTLPAQITGSGAGMVRSRHHGTDGRPSARALPAGPLVARMRRCARSRLRSVTRVPVPIRLPGGRLEAVRLVPREARPGLSPVVFLHDALGSISLWRDLPDRLCGALGREGLVFDRLGFGRSDPRPGAGRAPRFLEIEATERASGDPPAGRNPPSRPLRPQRRRLHRPPLRGGLPGGPRRRSSPSRRTSRRGSDRSPGSTRLVEAWRTTDLPERLARHHGEKAEAVFRRLERDVARSRLPRLLGGRGDPLGPVSRFS